MPDASESARAYVDDLRRRGFPDAEIAQTLLRGGWSPEQISSLVDVSPEKLTTPAPLPPPAYAPAPARPEAQGSAGLATAALVMGLISIALPLSLITGPLAVIFGGVSLARRRPGSGMATTGLILGVVCWLLTLVLVVPAAIMFPVFSRAREKAVQNSCLSNVKQLTLGMLMYASDYDERCVPADRWPELIYPYVNNDAIYLCSEDQRSSKQSQGGHETSYTMSRAAGGVPQGSFQAPAEMGIIFDGTQVAGDGTVAEFRHNGGLNLGYADGHARWLEQSAFGMVPLSPSASAAQPPPAPMRPSSGGSPGP